MTTTVIRNAEWVIAWDEAAGHHVYRRGIDVAFGDTIAFAGRDYAGAADRVIDGKDRLVLPGLIDIHSHPEHEPLYRGVREEHGVRNMHMTGLYERSQAFSAPDDEARGGERRIRLLRALAERRHVAGRHLAGLGRLDRPVRQERPARLSGARLRLGALAARKRLRAEIRLGRGARPRGLRDRPRIDRPRRATSERTAVRRRFADADRELHRRSLTRQPRCGARAWHTVHRAHRAERRRGAGDDPAPRQDAGPVGARDRHPRPGDDTRPRAVSRWPFLDPLVDPDRSAADRRDRVLGRPLPDAVRALWPGHGEFRRLFARRRQYGARHRHDAAQSGRGDAQGRRARPHRGARHRDGDGVGPAAMRRRWAGPKR